MTGWIGLTLGDVTGIGPEVTLKTLAQDPGFAGTRFLLIGDSNYARQTNERLGLGLDLRSYEGPESAGRFFLFDPRPAPLEPGLASGSPSAAAAALDWLRHGAERCLRQELDALVTAPVNKESIIRSGHPFVGQTEFLSQLSGTERTTMMLLGSDERGRWLRVALATTHIPLKFVADQLQQARIELAIGLAAQACRDLGLTRARIGVCGLNPHAGEGGELGTEEITTISPAIQTARERGLDVEGPLAADTLFHMAFNGEFDAVVAMYHDQGLVPLKMIGFETGVNWTLGLPFIRTSPDHGTAYNIAGHGKANPSSMRAALTLAKRLSGQPSSPA
jgi:4-hydroxythreonine-4-phosphate dehydrogenase